MTQVSSRLTLSKISPIHKNKKHLKKKTEVTLHFTWNQRHVLKAIYQAKKKKSHLKYETDVHGKFLSFLFCVLVFTLHFASIVMVQRISYRCQALNFHSLNMYQNRDPVSNLDHNNQIQTHQVFSFREIKP